MKKKFILSFVFLLCLVTILNCYQVQATSVSDFDTVTQEEVEKFNSTGEGKIMKYDAKTRESTEVDMNTVRQALESKSARSHNSNSTSSYVPKLIDRSNILNPYNVRTSYYSRIYNTSVFPYTTISKITNAGGSGSGTIIGKNVAITVAHVVMDGNCNIYDNLSIHPGYNGRT